MIIHRSISGILFFLFLLLMPKGTAGQLFNSEQQQIDTSDYVLPFFSNWLESNLMIAASKGYASEINRIIKMGADVNASTYEGATPLVFAVTSGKPEAVSAVLNHEPEIDKVTMSFETPLMIAVKSGFFEITELLIRSGADIDFNDNHGATPLHYASLYSFLDITDLLLYYDAQPDIKTDDGTTPLLSATWVGNIDIADILLQNGASPDEKDDKGFTPFLVSSYYGDTLLMEILRSNGADIYLRNNDGDNALTLAIIAGREESIRYLLRIGNRWSQRSENSLDPITIAAKYGRKDIIDLLNKNGIPGHVRHNIDQVSFNVSTRFTTHDFSTGLSMIFKEPLSNIGIISGIDIKPFYTRVLVKESDSEFYQYMDKGSLAYAGIFKEFEISEVSNKFNICLNTSISAGYSFGNNLKGTFIVPDNKLSVIPALSLNMQHTHVRVSLGAEYVNSEFHKVGPVWLRLGIGYNYYFDNIRKKIKPPRWF
ncbi:MAG TPA: ankyrin repeat domain-containing protein [Bacteroidales bacterium]|nr:ankyrin repeat domain-containing protein [Bacteroidales bacterium]